MLAAASFIAASIIPLKIVELKKMDTKKTMEPIDVYIMYCAMKAHFSRKDYDFFKYGGKTKVSRDSFWKRKDRISLSNFQKI